MMVPVNENIDAYKDDFFKGLTMRQTLYAASAVMVSGGLLAFFLICLKMNASLAMYLTLPAAFPIIAAGFVKVHGISLGEYLKRKRKAEAMPGFFYQPEMVFWLDNGMMPADMPGGPEKKEEGMKPKKIYLETEETVGGPAAERKEEGRLEADERLPGTDRAALRAAPDGPAAHPHPPDRGGRDLPA